MPEDLDTFRGELRMWLQENCPEEMRDGYNTEEGICWGGKNWESGTYTMIDR